MAKEIDPKSTTRAKAFEFWMQAPNPMVTFFKTLNVTRLVKISKKRGLKFNMLMDYCIGKAAASIKEFYMLPVNGKLMQYDSIAVNTIVKNDKGEVSSCDIHIPKIWRRSIATTSNTQKSWRKVARIGTCPKTAWSLALRLLSIQKSTALSA